MTKLIAVFFIYSVLFISCGENKPEENKTTSEEDEAEPLSAEEKLEAGKVVYLTNCKLCHGEDGTLGNSGASNLKTSVLSAQDIHNIVSYGKPGTGMMAYKDLLKPDEIDNVVAYLETLRK